MINRPDPIFKAIEAHVLEHERFNRACSATDDVAAKREGRTVTASDRAEFEAANAADFKTLTRLAKTRPTTKDGVRALIAYALECLPCRGWDEDTLSDLLTSIAESAPLQIRPKAAA